MDVTRRNKTSLNMIINAVDMLRPPSTFYQKAEPFWATLA